MNRPLHSWLSQQCIPLSFPAMLSFWVLMQGHIQEQSLQASNKWVRWERHINHIFELPIRRNNLKWKSRKDSSSSKKMIERRKYERSKYPSCTPRTFKLIFCAFCLNLAIPLMTQQRNSKSIDKLNMIQQTKIKI